MKLAVFVAALLPLRFFVTGSRVVEVRAGQATLSARQVGTLHSAVAEADADSRQAAAQAKEGLATLAMQKRPEDLRRIPAAPPPPLLWGPETRDEIDDEDREYDYDPGLEATDLDRWFEEEALGTLERSINGTRHRCGPSGVEVLFDFSGETIEDDRVVVAGRSYLPMSHVRQGEENQLGAQSQHGFLLIPLGPEGMTGHGGVAYEVWISRIEQDPLPSIKLTRLRNFEIEEEMHCMLA